MIKKNVKNVGNSVIALETTQRCFILVTLKRILVNKKQVNVNFKLTKGAETEMLVSPPPDNRIINLVPLLTRSSGVDFFCFVSPRA